MPFFLLLSQEGSLPLVAIAAVFLAPALSGGLGTRAGYVLGHIASASRAGCLGCLNDQPVAAEARPGSTRAALAVFLVDKAAACTVLVEAVLALDGLASGVKEIGLGAPATLKEGEVLFLGSVLGDFHLAVPWHRLWFRLWLGLWFRLRNNLGLRLCLNLRLLGNDRGYAKGRRGHGGLGNNFGFWDGCGKIRKYGLALRVQVFLGRRFWHAQSSPLIQLTQKACKIVFKALFAQKLAVHAN